MQYMMEHGKTSVSPTPRKKSMDMIEEKMNQIFFNNKSVGFIGISGGQASGKTKIANYFHKNIKNSAVISEKSFFLIEKLKKDKISEDNFVGESDSYSQERKVLLTELSNPKSYDYNKLINCLKKLIEGESIKVPIFNQEKREFSNELNEINPKEHNLIIIEGYFIYNNPELKDMFDLKLYTQVDDDVRLSRLILRENVFLKNNANDFKIFFLIYEKYLKTSFEAYIEPGKQCANIILPNYEISENDEIKSADGTLEFLLINLMNIHHKIKG
jgi:uridine kinase